MTAAEHRVSDSNGTDAIDPIAAEFHPGYSQHPSKEAQSWVQGLNLLSTYVV